MKAAALEDNREEWLADAVATILCLANERDTFSADDVAKEMRPPAQPNWAGIAFTVATNRGYIHSVGRKKSPIKSRKGARIDIWAAVKEES